MKRPDTVPQGTLDRTTPVPNALIDAFLPHLSDTELRVLLVVDRATLGWKEGVGRKKSDWLSHRQLQARTGRAGASVSHAVEHLVRRGLLVVEDGDGRARDSAASRRAARGRLYFRLGDALLRPDLDQSLTAAPQASDLSVAERIAPEEQQEKRKSPQDAASSSLRRLQKLKTTKETGTKEKKETLDTTPSLESEVNFLHDGSGGDGTEAVQDYQAEDLEAQTVWFLGVFSQAYRLARPGEAVPPFEDADRALLRRFLGQPGPAVLKAWLPAFFASSFGYAQRRGWSLGCYLNCLFILQARSASNPLRKGTWQHATREG